ncbi:MAG: hypothetical protein QXY67_07660, partial [Zestosphaera sp.]
MLAKSNTPTLIKTNTNTINDIHTYNLVSTRSKTHSILAFLTLLTYNYKVVAVSNNVREKVIETLKNIYDPEIP